jgi:hypothetical protein
MQEYNSPVDPDQIGLLDYDLANQFVCFSAAYFTNEPDRFIAIRPTLQHFLGKDFIPHGSMHFGASHWTPDGHAPVKCGIYGCTNPGISGWLNVSLK